jgi:hypothetical protein
MNDDASGQKYKLSSPRFGKGDPYVFTDSGRARAKSLTR